MSKKVIVRSVNAGVFYGRLISRDGDTATLADPRRIWYWSGAASLSELATRGPGKPDECKFPAPTVGEHVVLGVCEIIPTTEEARAAIDAVPVWSAR